MEEIEIVVYGAEVICPSCVGQPSSIDTFEWLQAAVNRKYENNTFIFSYVDIFNCEHESEEKREMVMRVIEEDLFYPVTVINNKVIAEGSPRLKVIYDEMNTQLGRMPQ